MLKSLDILIGLAVVMLVASMATMMLTQLFVGLIQSRGRHLRKGLGDLLVQIDHGIAPDVASEIARAVLLHPLVRGSKYRPGSVVKREELTKLLFGFAQKEPRSAADPALSDIAREALHGILAANGVTHPDRTLANIRMRALELERTHPELAAAARHTLAITHEAPSDFVAKLNASFDGTMDRVSERFTFSTRIVTFVAAIVVAGGVQLDVFGLINRLALDDSLRRTLVAQAVQIQAEGNAQPAPDVPPAAAGEAQVAAAPPPETALSGANVDRDALARAIREAGIVVPPDLTTWRQNWRRVNVLGVVLAVFLMSLGAPFWFKVLNGTLRLRSVLAGKDDVDRAERQSTQTSTGAPGTGTLPAARAATIAGERGDLTAVG